MILRKIGLFTFTSDPSSVWVAVIFLMSANFICVLYYFIISIYFFITIEVKHLCVCVCVFISYLYFFSL